MNAYSQHIRRSRYKKAALILTILVIIYSLAGFVLLPWVAKPRLVEAIAEFSGRETQLDKLRVNPFTLSVTLEGFEIKEDSGDILMGFSRTHANLELLPLIFKKEIHLKSLEVVDPAIEIRIEPDGQLNLADILDRVQGDPTGEEQTESTRQFHLRIDRMRIRDGSFSLADLSRSTLFETIFSPINVTISDFHTSGKSDAPYSFSATTESGESVEWEGFVALAPFRSSGSVKVSRIHLPKYEPFYDLFLRTNLVHGILGASGSYDYIHGAGGTAILRETELNLDGLELHKEDGSPVLSLRTVKAGGIMIDAPARKLAIETLQLSGEQLLAKREADGEIDLLKLVRPAPSVPEESDPMDPGASPLSFLFGKVEIDFDSITLIDEAAPETARVDLKGTRLEINNLGSAPGTIAAIGLATSLASGGTVELEGEALLDPSRASLEWKIDSLNLTAGNPYIWQFADISLADGELNSHGSMDISLIDKVVSGQIQGELQFMGIRAINKLDGDDLASISLLTLSGIEASIQPHGILIKEISLVDPRAQLRIEEDGRNSLQKALRIVEETPSGENSEITANDDAPDKGKFTTGLPFPVSIGSVRITNAGMDLVDESVEPVVELGVDSLSGTVAGLSSEEVARADMELEGILTGGTRLSVSGSINPLISERFSDVEVEFSGFNLKQVSAYSGKYAGYKLDRGDLSFDLKYKVSQSELSGENIMIIDQLTLGEKVDSEEATNLPIPLAVALLKDANGVIEIDVPVRGNLNDPDFSFGRVIGRAFLNILTKVVTSPFSILGALVSGGEDIDLSQVSFEPGSDILGTKSLEILDLLAHALTERPILHLKISPSAGGDDEIEALKLRTLNERLHSMHLAQQGLQPEEAKIETGPLLTREERSALIKTAYLATQDQQPTEIDGEPAPPAQVSPQKESGGLVALLRWIFGISEETGPSQPEEDALAADNAKTTAVTEISQPTVEEMETDLLSQLEIDPAIVTQLAEKRATAILDYLSKVANIPMERLSIAPSEKTDSAEPVVRFDLQ